jgi:hypothetical protein
MGAANCTIRGPGKLGRPARAHAWHRPGTCPLRARDSPCGVTLLRGAPPTAKRVRDVLRLVAMGSHGLREDAAVAVDATAVTALAWRAGGVTRVTVIAKASFAFAHDAPMPRREPQAVLRAEVHHGNSPMRSVRFTTDLAPYLHQADIVFTGHACAGSVPLETIMVRLGVFDGPQVVLDKTLIVREKGGFTRKPIVYEHAYGGIGWSDNPYGVGAMGGSPTILHPSDDKRLAGFGPIGQGWPARKRLLGVTPRKAIEAPIAEIPEGFDWSYFQAAPPDQRVDYLRGDEWIVMDGLHPSIPRARMQLPGARGLARVYGLSAHGVVEGQPLVLHVDTLRIDGDELRCTLTFRGVFPVVSDDALAALTVVAGVETPGAPIAWPDPEVVAARAAAHTGNTAAVVPSVPAGAAPPILKEATITLEEDDFESLSGNAFAGTLALDPEASEAAAHQAAVPFAGKPGGGRQRTVLVAVPGADDFAAPVMPFRPGASPLAKAGAEAAPRWAGTSLGETMASAPEPPEPPPEAPVAPVAAPPPPPSPPPAAPVAPVLERKAAAASPWAPPPPPAPKPAAPPPPAGPPTVTPSLKKGLYGRFGSNR